MKTSTKTAGIFAALIIGLFLSSCKKNNDTTPADVKSQVQFVNASPDAGPANLYIMDTLKSAANVTYGNTGGYFSNPNSIIRQTIKITSPTNDALVTASSGFAQNEYYSVYLTGQKISNNLGVIVSADDETLPAAGNARIKFVNAAPNSGLLTLSSNNTAIFTGQGYGSTTKCIELAAGNYVFNLNGNGFQNSITMPSQTLISGKIYTIYARNAINNGLTVLDAGVFANN